MQEGMVYPRMKVAKKVLLLGVCTQAEVLDDRGEQQQREAEGQALREPEPPADGDLSQP